MREMTMENSENKVSDIEKKDSDLDNSMLISIPWKCNATKYSRDVFESGTNGNSYSGTRSFN
jgi:hypothetical protein